MSTELHTLSGAYAVDALSDDEARLFDTHLKDCQACRDEVRELQHAAALMGASESVAPPAALRARVLAAADREAQLPPKVTAIGAAPSRRRAPRLVAAAAAVVLVLTGGFAVLKAQRDDSTHVASTVSQVFKAPDARTRSVPTTHGTHTVAASPSMGRMAVDTDGLQKLSGKRVYQLWAVHAGTMTSVGIVDDLDAGKAMAIPGEGTTVSLTVEPEGGSEQPTTTPFVNVDPKNV
jgi:anti-sigma-K factor RskA